MENLNTNRKGFLINFRINMMPQYGSYSLDQLKWINLKNENKLEDKIKTKTEFKLNNNQDFEFTSSKDRRNNSFSSVSNSLSSDLILLMKDDSTADVKINLKDGVYKSHKLILSMRCKKFKDAFYTEKKEEFDLKEVEYSIFSKVVEWIYTGGINTQSIPEAIKTLDAANILEIKPLYNELLKGFQMKELTIQESLDVWVWSFERKTDQFNYIENIVREHFFQNCLDYKDYLFKECVKWNYEFIDHYMKTIEEWIDFKDRIPRIFYNVFTKSVSKWASVNSKSFEEKERFIKRCLTFKLLNFQEEEIEILNEIIKELNQDLIQELFDDILSKLDHK